MRDENREREWVCGKCGYIWALPIDASDPGRCPDCGYIHGQRKSNDVPEEVKLKIRR